MWRTLRIRRIAVLPAVWTGIVVFGATGFVFGILVASSLAIWTSVLGAAFSADVSALSVVLLVILPPCATITGAVFGGGALFVGTVAYNILAGTFGGMELDVEHDETDAVPPFPV